MVLLSRHLCLTVDPSEEFILNWCSSLWHLLKLCCCLPPLSKHVPVCYARDTSKFPFSWKLFKNSAGCSRSVLPNNALNIKAKLKNYFPRTLFMLTESSCRNYQPDKKFGKENINFILPSFFFFVFFWREWKISHVAKARKGPVQLSKTCLWQ